MVRVARLELTVGRRFARRPLTAMDQIEEAVSSTRTKQKTAVGKISTAVFGPSGDNGFDTNTMKSAVSARVSELDASISRHRALQFDHFRIVGSR